MRGGEGTGARCGAQWGGRKLAKEEGKMTKGRAEGTQAPAGGGARFGVVSTISGPR